MHHKDALTVFQAGGNHLGFTLGAVIVVVGDCGNARALLPYLNGSYSGIVSRLELIQSSIKSGFLFIAQGGGFCVGHKVLQA